LRGMRSRSRFLRLLLPRPPISTLFPYTTLFRSLRRLHGRDLRLVVAGSALAWPSLQAGLRGRRAAGRSPVVGGGGGPARPGAVRDRKSTRLNSSHQISSYAVLCLKKKTHKHVAA